MYGTRNERRFKQKRIRSSFIGRVAYASSGSLFLADGAIAINMAVIFLRIIIRFLQYKKTFSC